ncbi:unnamed protein product [Polarella glacialis]|uniref:CSD domain-containing protein n=1 Tax=Polarella glacialis TaxID=89957 RepID=A0A813JU04_POLGL|nr:unnamed protein product [Polarella glacialis]CAE8682880.1 unnamed protein product [Polarella glacialis]CAE8727310.1 unnamed protein product [Polarella glacialis]
MPSGVVLRWNSDKGFGFIKPDDDGPDLFAHVSQLLGGEGSVRDGDEVRFKVEYDDRKGKDRATNVEVIGGGGGGGRGRSRSRSPPRRSGGGDRGGGGGGGGGGGDRKAGDWDCEKCGAMVFASKDACFKCNEPKGGGGGGGRGGGRDRSNDRDDRRDRGRDDRDRDRDRDRRRDRSYSR